MRTFLYTTTIILLAIALQSCNFKSVRGNGNVTENIVNISDYNQIKFSGGATLVYEQKADTTPYLRIEVDDNIFPLLIIESGDNTLSIKSKENISPTRYNIYTNSSGLKGITASGSIKAHLKGKVTTPEFNFCVSGSGNIQADSIISNIIRSSVSGSGNITLVGKAGFVDSSISGSGKVNAASLVADTVECSVSGSGNFFVHAEKHLKVRVSGSGDVKYKGDPKIDQSISGSGKVIKAD
ncbi:hypothetical protein M2451_000331 [Dysgonomonas sp. PFB1-18]|uniref:head GIN domain-containing protein n=1 Tax=unclassified Dysgonomonas TaxID=2630389 RepID=UPI00247719E6|nr:MULTISPECIES: head GIN domain-containing protein [unclassified Dysgonomonas]MDH6307882.1 hypothetical protein [Dysgonomonas sp. PF1-14]MDH6337800.1 hypothetical protein [Dysgonomonas sp. PF1-16]MDH6379024.1 hypothetical protein [Dysgonomonas sp. PFB1-18]MDH6396659.1 hypothetical protein [Dysgonomonas sp. PF1-23]